LNIDEWKENSYVIYVYELQAEKMAYVGLTNDIIRRDREHLFDEKETLYKFIKEHNMSYPKYKILEENLKSIDAQKQEKYWLKNYKDNGWLMFNSIKAGALGGNVKIWSKKKLQNEANKYKTRSEFCKKNSSAYVSASNKKLIDELFKDHPN